MNSSDFLNSKEESEKSGSCTPIFSWSPLPQRRNLGCIKQENKDFKSEDKSERLYPNTDATVWLRSCEEEITKPIIGNVTGIIPNWLNGSLIRNGPGSLKVGREEFTHLFDSSALLHRFGIKYGKVEYSCRFVQSEVFKQNWAANRIVKCEFGTKIVEDPCHSIFKRIAAVFQDSSDNSMISVYPFGDELYAFGETPQIHKINPDTLETEDKVAVNDYVSIVHHTSHPHVLNDGTIYNLGLSVRPTGLYHSIVEFQKNENGSGKQMFEEAQIVASISARWQLNPSYMHTFGITENYYILVEQPLSISVPRIFLSKFNNGPLADCFRWYHDEYTRISVISRSTNKIFKTYLAEAFFYLHIINQYEFENHLVLDICMYNDPAMLDCMYVEAMKTMQTNPDYAKMFRGRPGRFVLPLNSNSNTDKTKNLVGIKNTRAKAYYMSDGNIFVKPEKLCDLGCETPRIHYEKYLGKPYKYFYAISSDVDSEIPGTLIKVDVESKTTKTWGEPNCYPSEPIFVPNPEPKSEDDGVVISAMVWGEEDTNHVGLLVLDGESFIELGRAEFHTPSPAPKCLHGWFLPSKE
ncbi:carotenoid isomerooxygenase isoform X1 [Diabrotica virgifera virgifera]|uniref:Carotenoid isomerooxygenase n=1 Tax=Diabrotica virgifera virgifera TaxID=50390 RepID=A0ABM5K1M6_DIAVI|nr:carotenoid isomerooxygenase isoform X1 [Diabrotica virgifera virgifera]